MAKCPSEEICETSSIYRMATSRLYAWFSVFALPFICSASLFAMVMTWCDDVILNYSLFLLLFGQRMATGPNVVTIQLNSKILFPDNLDLHLVYCVVSQWNKHLNIFGPLCSYTFQCRVLVLWWMSHTHCPHWPWSEPEVPEWVNFTLSCDLSLPSMWRDC